jgi:hypothetical protein
MEDRGEIERVVVTGRRFGYRESDIDDIVAGRGKRTSGHKGWIKQDAAQKLSAGAKNLSDVDIGGGQNAAQAMIGGLGGG